MVALQSADIVGGPNSPIKKDNKGSEQLSLDDEESDWAQKGLDIDEVVEDALTLEDNKQRAYKALTKISEKAASYQTNAIINDEKLKSLQIFFGIQSVTGLLLAVLILYLNSTGSYTMLTEISYASTCAVMIATIFIMSVIGAAGVTPKGGGAQMVKYFSEEIRSTLLLLEGVTSGDASSNSAMDSSLDSYILPPQQWSEPEATTFKVRGPSYLKDKKKVPSEPGVFKLLAIDIMETPDNIQHVASQPSSRVAKMKARGDSRFIFVFNFMIPGPPFLAFTAYWEMNKKAVEDTSTPFGRLAKPFFFGDSDEFRNDRFKFIPKVIEGNFAIRMAVKDTPTLMGHKLKQYYYRGDNYFEIDVDISSSSVARNITGLVIGYAKTLVIDMALCLEGRDEKELPEVVLGTCSARHVDVYNVNVSC